MKRKRFRLAGRAIALVIALVAGMVAVAGATAAQQRPQPPAANPLSAALATADRLVSGRVAELRARAAQMAPPEPVTLPAAPAAAESASPYAQMGIVDDAEIEQHVRQLLQRRATG